MHLFLRSNPLVTNFCPLGLQELSFVEGVKLFKDFEDATVVAIGWYEKGLP